MQNIYLLQFNNYMNRQYKPLTNDALASAIATYTNINFIENDGINTEVILNRNYLEEKNADYLVAVSTADATDYSAWFIMGSQRLRNGQVKYKLKADLVAMNWDAITSSQLMIERGYCDAGNPLFFQPEPISVNEVLTDSKPLMDYTKCNWLVAYVNKGESPSASTIEFGNTTQNYNESYDSVNALKSALYDGKEILYKGTSKFVAGTNNTASAVSTNLAKECSIIWQNGSVSNHYIYGGWVTKSSEAFDCNDLDYQANIVDNWDKIADIIISNDIDDNIIARSKVIDKLEKTTGKVYKIGSSYYTISYSFSTVYVGSTEIDKTSNIALKLLNVMSPNGGTAGIIQLSGFYTQTVKITLTDVTQAADTWTVSSTKANTIGQEFDVWCAPYLDEEGSNLSIVRTGQEDIELSSELTKDLFTKFASKLGSAYVMDIQLLPFCPINYLSVDGNSIDVSGLANGTDYTLSSKERSIVFYCRSCDREFYINNSIGAASNKTTYLTKKYRLCSNNFSASYDIPVYENQGIDKFHVKMTCLPYSPWINIHINYKGLNGIDNDDAKGLTLGGSFGLSMSSNAWTEYQYNNSNYSQLFESQLEYQKYQQKMNMISSGISSSASAIGSGVGVGALLGGPVGIAAGIATGIASAGAGIADLAIQNKMNQASNEYSRTQYNLQLGNIKAKPSTLSRITAFNCSTKQFPYLEEYTCTTTEQEQIESWLKANGQTIGAVGHLADYVKSGSDETFVKAGIVRFNSDIAKQCDASIVAGINSELNQGIYIRGDDI